MKLYMPFCISDPDKHFDLSVGCELKFHYKDSKYHHFRSKYEDIYAISVDHLHLEIKDCKSIIEIIETDGKWIISKILYSNDLQKYKILL